MHKAYVRELKPYSLGALVTEFNLNTTDALKVIEDLLLRGIVRYRSDSIANDWDNVDEDSEANADELYKFVFVGMVIIHDIVLICYPKYFRDRKPTEEELRQIFRLLKRSAKTTSIGRISEDGKKDGDKLPVMLTLLDLYAEYGIYSNFIEGRELNGQGVTDWNRTIGNHLPIVVNGRPIYVEYETRKAYRDESDYITRLHRAVLTECSKELFEAGVGDILSLDEVHLSDEDVDDLGDSETLEWRLEKERSSQFMDWKIMILNLLKRYLSNRESATEVEEIKTFGTASFYNIWEAACKVAFGDELDTKLSNLGFSLVDKWAQKANMTLLEIIPHPKWERYKGGGYSSSQATATLIPDTISFVKNDKNERVFCIYDAKYYVPTQSGRMEHQPGLESVTKQFLYQSAYEQFIKNHGFNSVVNAFLVPTAGDDTFEIGRVSFEEVMGEVEPPLSNYIYMWALPARQIFEAYLSMDRIGANMIYDNE